MSTPARPPQSQLLEQLIAGQATSDSRFEELFRRLARAEETAGEARDTAREVVTILREQDLGSRVAEVRAELKAGVEALRQDVVAANKRLREDLDTEVKARGEAIEKLEGRIEALEAERNKVVGVAAFFSWLARVAPWLIAIGAGMVAGLELKNGH